MLAQGSYGILRSREGWVESRIVFTGLMTMIGIDTDLATRTKKSTIPGSVFAK